MSFNFQGRFILMFLHFSLGISCGMILEELWPFSHSPQPVLSILQKNQNHLKIKEITQTNASHITPLVVGHFVEMCSFYSAERKEGGNNKQTTMTGD